MSEQAITVVSPHIVAADFVVVTPVSKHWQPGTDLHALQYEKVCIAALREGEQNVLALYSTIALMALPQQSGKLPNSSNAGGAMLYTCKHSAQGRPWPNYSRQLA